jgi:hypothetical protein
VSPQILFALQFTMSVVLFAAIAAWYVVPWMNRVPTHTALAPLFLVHVLRYLPSSAFAPGQVGASVPMDAMSAIAYGDLLSAVFALIAALFLFYRWPGAIGVAWVVNVVTAADWLYAGYVAASRELVTYPMGGNWYIINYYVPLIGVVHVLIFARLLWHSSPHPLTAS